MDDVVERIIDSMAWLWWDTLWSGARFPVNRAWRGDPYADLRKVKSVFQSDIETYVELFKRRRFDYLRVVEETR